MSISNGLSGFTQPSPGSEVQFGPGTSSEVQVHSAPGGLDIGSRLQDTLRRCNSGFGARRRMMATPFTNGVSEHGNVGSQFNNSPSMQHPAVPGPAFVPNGLGDAYGYPPRRSPVAVDQVYTPRPVHYGCNTMQIQPDTYDGRGVWKDYVVQFEMVSIQNGWNEGTNKALFLATYLRRKAREVLWDLDVVTRMDYNALCSVLKHRFGAGGQAELFKVQWKSRSRNKGENLPELSQAIRRLTKQAYPTAQPDLLEMLAKDRFIDALDDADIRWHVLQQNHATLNEACISAVQLEAYKTAEKHRDRGISRSLHSVSAEIPKSRDGECDKMDRITKQLADLTDLVTLLQNIVSKQQSQQNSNKGNGNYRSNKNCYNCGDPNHFARNCPEPIKDEKIKKSGNEYELS